MVTNLVAEPDTCGAAVACACRVCDHGLGVYPRWVSAEAAPVGQRPLPPIRVSHVIFVVVAFIAVGGIAYLSFTSGAEEVYVADGDLPAYHQITERDVEIKLVDRHRLSADAVRDRDTLLGRYTLASIRQDQPFQSGQLGPHLPEATITDKAIVALPWSPETAIGGRLARGDRVDILLSSNNNPGAQAAGLKLTNVLVLDVIDGKNAAVIVAIPASSIDGFAAARGSSTIVVVRVRPYGVP
jgi:Flp pilus assembly protein CpaB